MVAKRIKELIKDFESESSEAHHYKMASHNREYSDEQRIDFVLFQDLAEMNCIAISNEMKSLNPSKYMMNKYPILNEILEYAYI